MRAELADRFLVTSFVSILEHRHPSVADFYVTAYPRKNKWITDFNGSWISMILLASEPN